MHSKHRNSFVRSLYAKVGIFALIVLSVLIGNAAVNMYDRYREAHIRADRAQEELELLMERKKKLTADLERLSTSRGTEEELRKRFNVAEEGEKIIIIVDPREETQESGLLDQQTIWKKILNTILFRN